MHKDVGQGGWISAANCLGIQVNPVSAPRQYSAVAFSRVLSTEANLTRWLFGVLLWYHS